MSFATRIAFLAFLGGLVLCLALLHVTFNKLGFEIFGLIVTYFILLGCLGGKITTQRGSEHSFWSKYFLIVVFVVAWLVLTNYTDYNGFIVTTFVVLFFESTLIYSLGRQLKNRNKPRWGFVETRPTREEVENEQAVKELEKKTPEEIIKESKIIDETGRGILYQHKRFAIIKVLYYVDKKLDKKYTEFVLPEIITVEDAFKYKAQMRKEDEYFFTAES